MQSNISFAEAIKQMRECMLRARDHEAAAIDAGKTDAGREAARLAVIEAADCDRLLAEAGFNPNERDTDHRVAFRVSHEASSSATRAITAAWL